MKRLTFLASTFAVAVLTLALAAPADAQRRPGGGGGGAGPRPGAGAPVRPNPGHGGQVAVPRPAYPHGGYPYRSYYGRYPYYGYGHYSPYYYAPYWGIGFGFSWGWGYPYWGWGYPYYGYGYGYGGYPYWYGYPSYGYGYPYDPTGSLRIEVKPRETQVYVDGYLAGVSDDFDGTFQRLHVRPGEHHLLLHLNGYKNASQTIYVQPGNTYKITHQMEPLPQGAPQDPIPTPEPGAAAGQNERPPTDVQARPAPYYPPHERESNPPREPYPPQQPPADQPRNQSQFGAVAIRVQPPDSGIMIDGQAWRGPTDEDGAVVIQLSAGTHRVEIARDGFERYQTEIDVRPGATTPLNVMLQRR